MSGSPHWSQITRGQVTNASGKSVCKGVTLMELFRTFPGDASAERRFEEPKGEAGESGDCPRCGCGDRSSVVPSDLPLSYWRGPCHHNFRVWIGTVMHRSRIGLLKTGHCHPSLDDEPETRLRHEVAPRSWHDAEVGVGHGAAPSGSIVGARARHGMPR